MQFFYSKIEQQLKNIKNLYFKLLIHIISLSLIGVLLLILFFNSILPLYTRKNEKILVPDLNNKSLEETKEILLKNKLKYKIKDQDSFNPELPPNHVLYQNPKQGTFVKKNRTIYLSLNADKPPLINFPNLLFGSLRNATLILKTHGFKLGSVKYIPDIAKNTVLKQEYNSKEILEGELLPRGAKINLIVGAGLSKLKIIVPNLLGKTKDEAELILKKFALKLGAEIYEKDEQNLNDPIDNIQEKPVIYKQIPKYGEKVSIGSEIDIWIDKTYLDKT